MKYQRFTPSDCKDVGIRNLKFIAKTQFLCNFSFCKNISIKLKKIYTKHSDTIIPGTSQYNPEIPAKLPFPGPSFCSANTKLMIIGSIPSQAKFIPAISIVENTVTEGLHININLKQHMIERYSVINGTKSDVAGAIGDGTSIDFDEPFILNLNCDQDGWNLQVNTELPYDTVLHTVPLENLSLIKVTGDIIVNFIGIGGQGNHWVFCINR